MATEASRPIARRNRRVLAVVAVSAAVAVAAVVGATLLQTRGERTTLPGAVTKPRAGRPPLELEFGLRSGLEARELAQAQALFDQDHQAGRAAAIFGRYHSPEAQLGVAFTTWRGPPSLAAVKALASAHPRDPGLLLNLGWAEYWAGRNAAAAAVWQKTASEYPDSPYGVDAEDALHPNLKIPGLPYIVLDFGPAPAVGALPAAREFGALARAATRPNVRAKLLYGSALWNNLKRPLSAERQFEAAAKLAPDDPVARTAAAVGAFTKADPVKAFGRLGPLTGVFPRAPVVRFHLGLLLLWTGQRQKAIAQLRLAAADQPRSSYAQDARRLLAKLPGTRSK